MLGGGVRGRIDDQPRADPAPAVSRRRVDGLEAAAVAGGLLAACLLGAVAGLYPAMRASRLTPTEALRTT